MSDHFDTVEKTLVSVITMAVHLNANPTLPAEVRVYLNATLKQLKEAQQALRKKEK